VSAPIIVVGGGLVGLATARALALGDAPLPVVLLEKEAAVGQHQSRHNSGVLHAGLHYMPGSAKARLAVRGIRQMREYCAARRIPHEICGKLVVASGAEQEARLRILLQRGERNGLSGLRWLGADAAREIEPHVRCTAAVHVPEEGIVDFPAVSAALAEELAAAGVAVRTGEAVHGLRRDGRSWVALTGGGEVHGRFVVNCAGLHADRVARLAGARPGCRIVPFRGQYYRLSASAQQLVRHLVYPVPDPALPFLGVHLTRLIGGGVEAGPTARVALGREAYGRFALSPRDAASALLYPGLWRFIAGHPRVVAGELLRSVSRKHFAAALQQLVPELEATALAPGGAGVRAQAMRADGRLVNDFLFEEERGALHVLNAPSPAATAALAIGEEIAARVRTAVLMG
jgi:(S)-2-hydroxyglutarate dehydrogenase